MNNKLIFNNDKYEILDTTILTLETNGFNGEYSSKSTLILIDCEVLYKQRLSRTKDKNTYLLVVDYLLNNNKEITDIKILENILKINILKNKQEDYGVDLDNLDDEIMDYVGELFTIHTTPIMVGWFSSNYWEDMRNRIHLENSNYLTTQFKNILTINAVYDFIIKKYNLKGD